MHAPRTHAGTKTNRLAPLPVSLTDVTQNAALADVLLALNNAHAQDLSWLDHHRMRQLISQAFLALRVGSVDAFLLAFDQDAAYDSPNFLWFRAHYPRFVYVDRVVCSLATRRRGHAHALYDQLFEAASHAGHRRVVCEVNADPPNPASDGFHAALGFAEVGTATLHGDGRTVRYLSRGLRAVPPA
jgi:uncharacterized protein